MNLVSNLIEKILEAERSFFVYIKVKTLDILYISFLFYSNFLYGISLVDIPLSIYRFKSSPEFSG